MPRVHIDYAGTKIQGGFASHPLEGSSLLLGINWLREYGKVTFDFQQNSVTLTKDGQTLTLKEIGEQAKLQLITADQWY